MIKKIAIIGSHSTGKTTLSYILAAQQKKIGRSVKIIQEVARSCPYPLNDGMTRESCLWIYLEHVKKELEAMQKFDTIICDRSAIDSFMYAIVKNCFHPLDEYMKHCFAGALEWMNTYDQIIYIEPGKGNPVFDGMRDTNKDFQMKVDQEFRKHLVLLDHKKIRYRNADDIFKTYIFKNVDV